MLGDLSGRVEKADDQCQCRWCELHGAQERALLPVHYNVQRLAGIRYRALDTLTKVCKDYIGVLGEESLRKTLH